MTSIYLAARFSRRYEMQGHRAVLQRLGHIVTSRWIDNSSDDKADALNCARIDLEDLEAADTVIAFGDEPRSNRSRGGHHVELGYALALGRRIMLVGYRENVFNYLPEVEFFENWPKALESLRAERSGMKRAE